MKKLFIALLALNPSIDALDAAASQPGSGLRSSLFTATRPDGQDQEPGRRAQVPLVAAAMEGNVGSVRSLLEEQGTDLNEVDAEGRWALLVATVGGNIEIMEMLLQARADPDFSGPDDPAPSGYEEGSIQVRASKGGKSPLLEAAKADNRRAVELLLEYGAAINKRGRDFTTPLFGAAAAGARNALEVLLQHRSNLERTNFDGWRPLEVAIQSGHTEVVRLLLEAGAIEEDRPVRYCPLVTAVLEGCIEAVRLLLAAGASIETDQGDPLLWIAADRGYTEVVGLLLQAGADPNKVNPDGIPPLWTAAAGGRIEVVELLLNEGVDPNATDPSGTTPMSIAETRGHSDVVTKLQLARVV